MAPADLEAEECTKALAKYPGNSLFEIRKRWKKKNP